MVATIDLLARHARPISRLEYERMVESGMFEGERVELLFGTVVTMSPHGAPHDDAVDEVDEKLARQLGDRAKVRVQSAFAASDGSEPEPDIAVVVRQSYRNAHPTQAWLIVEVAQTSLATDRGLKADLYAQSDVQEYWIVNLVDDVVEVHRESSGKAYTSTVTYGRGECIRLQAFEDVVIDVSEVLGELGSRPS